MNLRRASPEEKINVCRKYFLAGLPLLPWVWIVNVLWFWREATKPDHIPEVRKYVMYSAIGALAYLTVFGTWVGVYQSQRVAWGALGDRISIFVPDGEP
ncbi:hypothetical protein ACHWQZ_G003453 [Mnemiopsis leidyi]